MSRLLVLLMLGLLAGSACAEDVLPTDRAFIELIGPEKPVRVGQVFPLRLRVGYDRAFFKKRAVELFRRPMDLAVQVTAPWLRDAGALTFARQKAVGGTRIAVGDSVVEATQVEDVVRDERTYGVVELAWRVEASAAMKTDLEATLRFAHATQFEEDFVGGRVALDRRDVTLAATPLPLAVVPVDRRAAPDGYTGAIGRFTIGASVDRDDVKVGQIFRLTVQIAGSGNLASFPALRLDDLPGIHVYGSTDQTEDGQRTLIYELAVTSVDVDAVPAIAFVYLDPDANTGYRTLRTRPIPLQVEAGPDAGAAVPQTSPPPPETAVGEPRLPALLWIGLGIVVGLLLGLLLGLVLRSRARREPTVSPGAPAAHTGSTKPALPAVLDPTTEQGFVQFLARHLGVSGGAIVAPDLEERLRGAGVPGETARATARMLEAMVAGRYGGAPGPAAPDADLVEALEQSLRAAPEHKS